MAERCRDCPVIRALEFQSAISSIPSPLQLPVPYNLASQEFVDACIASAQCPGPVERMETRMVGIFRKREKEVVVHVCPMADKPESNL